MIGFYQAWLVMIDHSYAAIVEFVVEMGDEIVTHLITVIVIKAGVVHVGWKVVKHVRRRKTAVKPVVKHVQKSHVQHRKIHKKVGKATK